jgi:hypothetical protein
MKKVQARQVNECTQRQQGKETNTYGKGLVFNEFGKDNEKSTSTTSQRMHTTTTRKRIKYSEGLVFNEFSKDNEKKYKHKKTTNAQ